MKLEKCYHFRYILSVVVLIVLTGCGDSIKKGFNKRVEIEYDQRLNFHKFDFVSFVGPMPPDTQQTITPRGVWLLYHICSLTNNASEAQDFIFDVKKFYVVGNDDKKYFADDLNSPDLIPPNGSTVLNYPAIDDLFRERVQTAPMTKFIAAKSAPLFAQSWRFVIFMGKQSSGFDWMSSFYELRYDNSGGESLILTERGHLPDVRLEPKVTTESNFTNQCRPKIN